jgi:hypothetical protein
MNPNFNPPLYSPPPAQSFGYSPADYGRHATANMPSSMTSIYSNSAVAELLLRNFAYFSSGAAFVTRDSLIDFANRPLVDGGYHDQMTLVARDILGRGDLPRLFDGIQNGGQEDGLINQEDVELAINQLAQQDARGYRSAGYNGAMQQQRVNQQFAPAFCERPSSNRPRGMEGWDALPPAPRAFGAQQPSYAGMPVNQQWNPMTTGERPYANDSNESLSAKVLSHFSNLKDPSTGTLTDASLSAAASGHALDGRPISAADAAIAQELLERGQLFKTLDQGRSGTLDGSISRQDLGDAASEYRTNSNAELLQAVKDNFRQFTAGGTDDYVNVNELKEAAGLVPSDRTFSPQAREVALELLNRPGLLRELDIGVGEAGKPGYEDQRFDMVNIDHMIKKESSPERQA